MKIALLGAQINEPNCTHWSGIRWAMKQLGIEYYEIDVQCFRRQQALNEISKYKPNLLIHGLTDAFHQDYYKEIRQIVDGKIAFWYADYKDDRSRDVLNIDLRNYIDYMFVSNDSQRDFWKQKIGVEAHFVAMAGTPVDEIQFDPKYNNDIIFIGNVSNTEHLKSRGDLIQQIVSKTDVTVINKHTKPERMEVYKEMSKIYGSAKICLDISAIWHAEKYTSSRYYVIGNCGGFSLCKRFPGCEELYPDKIGKIYFDTVDEFIELKDYYLNRPEERKAIAMKGLEHSKKHHTYINRVNDILKICGLSK